MLLSACGVFEADTGCYLQQHALQLRHTDWLADVVIHTGRETLFGIAANGVCG